MANLNYLTLDKELGKLKCPACISKTPPLDTLLEVHPAQWQSVKRPRYPDRAKVA